FRTGPSTTAGCSHRRIRVDVQPLWRKKRCLGTAQDIFALTEPSLLSRGTRPEDWKLVCDRTSGAFHDRRLIDIVRWIASAAQKTPPPRVIKTAWTPAFVCWWPFT